MRRGGAPGELRLQLLGVIEVRDECRPHLDQQRFQLGILGARNQRLVERIDYRLMVGHLVIDVSL